MAAEVAGEGPAVLLLHGIPGSGAVWDEVRRRLSPTHRVIVPDLIGFGESARTEDIHDLWADAQAAAVSALLDDLQERAVVVVGHDFGGPVAAHLMARDHRRITGLVLAATNAFGDTPIAFPLSGILWPLVGGVWARALFSAPSLRMMVRQGVGTPSPKLDLSRYVGDGAQAKAIRLIFSAALRELKTRYEPVTALFRNTRVPTRVVWGDRDPFFPIAQARRTAALIGDARVVTLPGAGHFLPEERPAELADTIAALRLSIEQSSGVSQVPDASHESARAAAGDL